MHGMKRLFGESPARRAATSLYGAAVAQARAPVLYTTFEVPDTVDGRFDMVALHVFLLLRRLKAGGTAAAAVGQALYDVMFEDMDRSLREMGAGDLGVGRRVKTMAQAFAGRVAAYDSGLDGGGETLRAALARNVFRGGGFGRETAIDALARYLRDQDAALAAQPVDALVGGRAEFDAGGTASAGS